MPEADPFRAPDIEARVAALREERAALAKSLADAEAELRRLRPWSLWRFVLGMALPFGMLALMMLVAMLVSLVR